MTLERADGTSFDELRDSVCLYAPSDSTPDAPSESPDDPSSFVRLVLRAPLPASTRLVLGVRSADGAIRSRASIPCENGCVETSLRFTAPSAALVPDAAPTLRVEARLFDVVEVVLAPADARPDAGASDSDSLVLARIRVGSTTDTTTRCSPRVLPVRIDDVRGDPDAFAPSGVLQTTIARTHALLVENANRAFETCGITLRADEARPPVDPPPPFVLAIAEGDGLPARGGEIRFRANGRSVGPVTIPEGTLPADTANLVASAIAAAGLRAEVVVLPRLERAAYPAADVLVVDARGNPVTLTRDSRAPLTTDRRQRVLIGSVDLADGLDEYDTDRSLAGTLEERTLLYPWARRPPSEPRVHVVLVDLFGRHTRLGESFVPRDRGPLRGFVLIDRRGIAADPATYTLAHEVGHVLLDDPFHPPANLDGFLRVMARDSGRTDLAQPRAFTREECDRMRTHGAAFLNAAPERRERP